MRQKFSRNTDTAIPHANVHRMLVWFNVQFYASPYLRVFGGVGQHVAKHLRQPDGIAFHIVSSRARIAYAFGEYSGGEIQVPQFVRGLRHDHPGSSDHDANGRGPFCGRACNAQIQHQKPHPREEGEAYWCATPKGQRPTA